MNDEFVLNNDTLLRAYLAHLQSMARHYAGLLLERSAHVSESKIASKDMLGCIRDEWQVLNRDLIKVLGPEAALKPFEQLANARTFHTNPVTGRDPFRIKFRVLKKRADRARVSDPNITLLKSWDLKAKEPNYV